MTDPFDSQPPFPAPEPAMPTFPSAPPTMPPPTMPAAMPLQPPYAGPDNVIASAVIVPTRPPRKSNRGRMVGSLFGVVALLAAGTFAISRLRTNDSTGGAASPQDLGQKLVTAFGNEDALGAIDLLLPGERDTFRGPMIELVNQLSRLQITDGSATLSKIGGIDLSITDPSIDVQATNVVDVSNVTIAGTSSLVVDGTKVPIGDFLIQRVFGGKRPKLDSTKTNQPFHLKFASVRENGRWYVSLFYTAADSLRRNRDIPAHGVDPVGASSPSGALDNFLTDVANLDVEHLIASLNPNEAAALQRYAPLIAGDAQQSLDKLGVTMKISDTAYSVTGQGDTRQVALTAMHLTVDVPQQDVSADITLKNGCFTGTFHRGSAKPSTFDLCKTAASASDMIDKYLKGGGIDVAPVHKLIDDVQAAFADFSFHGVVVNNVGGKWYVSPIGTYTELFLSVLRALDRKEIDTITDDGTAVVKALSGAITNALGGTTITNDPFTTDPFTTDDGSFTTDPTTPDTVTVDTVTVPSTLTLTLTLTLTPASSTPDTATATTAG